jgi:hypothetical protein
VDRDEEVGAGAVGDGPTVGQGQREVGGAGEHHTVPGLQRVPRRPRDGQRQVLFLHSLPYGAGIAPPVAGIKTDGGHEGGHVGII